MNHLTFTQLQEFIDGLADAQLQREIESHVLTCRLCAERIQKFRNLDITLKRLPLDIPSPDFTQSVMSRLKMEEYIPFVWSLLKNLAPIFGLVIVVGIIYATLNFFEISDNSGFSESVQTTQTVYNKVGESISTGISVFNGWLEKLIPSSYIKNNYSIPAFLIILFIIIGVLDKFIFMPMVKRKIFNTLDR